MSIKIGIDGRVLSGKLTGIGRYTFELCKEFSKIGNDCEWYIFSKDAVEKPSTNPNWHYIIDDCALAKKLKPIFWLKTRCSNLIDNFDLDYFWAAGTMAPKLPTTTKIITTVYDLNYIIVPKSMPIFNYIANLLYFKKDIIKSDLLFTISKGTKDKLFLYFKKYVNDVIYPSASSFFYPPDIDKSLHYKSLFTNNCDYFLTLSTLEPRKNIINVIKGFEMFKSQNANCNIKLLIVGNKGWNINFNNIFKSFKYKHDFIFTGHLPDSDIIYLYRYARALFFPSWYEGFGIPILECLSCGGNVVASDFQEVREAGLNFCTYIYPSVLNICNSMNIFFKNPVFLSHNDALKRSDFIHNIFSWSKSANLMMKYFSGNNYRNND